MNNKTIKIITLLLGIVGGFFLGALIGLFAVIILSFKFNYFEGMKLMVAILLIMPIGAITGSVITGIIYNKRLKKILDGEITRKKELAFLIILPSALILINLFPRFTNLYSSLKPSQTINFTDSLGRLYYSSSELDKPAANAFGKYGAQNLFDRDKNTCWAEGVKGPGVKEYIYLDTPSNALGISIINGYAKSERMFKKNNRVKNIQITLYKLTHPKKGKITELYTPMKAKKISPPYKRQLKDSDSPQQIYFPKQWKNLIKNNKTTAIQIKILSVYKGRKGNDTCLSEISFFNDSPSKLFLSENEQELWLEKQGEKKLLLKSSDMIFQIFETEGDLAILMVMPAIAQGRVETHYILFNSVLKKEADFSKSGFNIGEIYGFIRKDEKLFIEAFDNTKGKEIQISLEKIKF